MQPIVKNNFSLLEAYQRIPDARRKEVNNLILTAALAQSVGNDWRRIFRKAKRECKGKVKMLYAKLYHLTDEEMEIFCNGMVKDEY